MNLHFIFSVREVSKVTDSEQTLQIPMYFTVSWDDDRLEVEQQHKAWSQATTGGSDGKYSSLSAAHFNLKHNSVQTLLS